MIDIYVDADACPVKDEIYRVAAHHGIHVVLVANSRMRTPPGPVEMKVVPEGPDAADDWIAENVRAADVVITADIPLAARCLEVGAKVLGHQGRPFDEDSIGNALASRSLMQDLREAGMAGGGHAPLAQKDRSRFLEALDRTVVAALNEVR